MTSSCEDGRAGERKAKGADDCCTCIRKSSESPNALADSTRMRPPSMFGTPSDVLYPRRDKENVTEKVS